MRGLCLSLDCYYVAVLFYASLKSLSGTYLFVIMSIDLLCYPGEEAGSLCLCLLCIFITSVPKLWVLKKNFSKER